MLVYRMCRDDTVLKTVVSSDIIPKNVVENMNEISRLDNHFSSVATI